MIYELNDRIHIGWYVINEYVHADQLEDNNGVYSCNNWMVYFLTNIVIAIATFFNLLLVWTNKTIYMAAIRFTSVSVPVNTTSSGRATEAYPKEKRLLETVDHLLWSRTYIVHSSKLIKATHSKIWVDEEFEDMEPRGNINQPTITKIN